MTEAARQIVVGIGASAGGLEALSAMVANLSATAGCCYVLAQHMSPQHRSMMVDLLGRSSTVKVVEAADGMVLDPNKLYVTPPNRNVEILGDHISLSDTFPEGPKPSVDLLFKSLAESLGRQAVGVVLSGTGSDGAQGIRAIKEAGGLTIAQEPSTAKYDSMPEAAIRTGSVDLILSPERIGSELASYAAAAPATEQEAGSDEPSNALATIIDLIRHRTNTDFEDYKTGTIGRRIDRRLAALRLDTLEDYADYLGSHPDEIEKLRADILISVTSFFRDQAAFEALDRVIGEVIHNKGQGEAVRVWVPGCATGEEVFSIAMLISERLRRESLLRRVQVFAVDIDENALAFARRATYPESALREVGPELFKRYFTRVGEDTFQVSKELRDCVVFSHQDITRDPPFSRLDLVSCRNLMIYFNPRLQTRVLEAFHYALNPNSILFLGKSESIGTHEALFSVVDRTHKIYRRNPGRRIPLGHFGGTKPFAVVRTVGEGKPEAPPVQTLMQKALTEAYPAPPSVVVDDTFRLYHVHGDVSAYLRLNPGKVEQDILTMATSELRATLRAVLHRSTRGNDPVVSLENRLPLGDKAEDVRVIVRRLTQRGSQPWLHMITFEPLPMAPVGVAGREVAVSADDETRIAELEHELNATREHLQTVIEELETANEELQATNEELQSSNEELQATNEELETTNEELQSTNEELETVNDELRAKSADLYQLTLDLKNVEESLDFPLLMVDGELRLRVFNRAARTLFGLAEDDVGMSVAQLPGRVIMPDLREKLISVIRSGLNLRCEVRDDNDRIYQKTVVPYHDPQRANSGAILSLIDVTDRVKTQQALAVVNNQFREAQRISHVGSWRLDLIAGTMSWSEEVFRICGLEPVNSVLSRDRGLSVFHSNDLTEISRNLDESARTGHGFGLQARVIRPGGECRTVWIEALCDIDEAGRVGALYGALRDITENVLASKLLTEGMARMKAVLDTIDDGIAVINTQGTILMANRALQHIFGYSESDPSEALTGRNVGVLMTDADQRNHQSYLKTYLTTGQRRMIGIGRDVLGRRRDGSVIPLELSVGEIFDELVTGDQENRRAFVATLRDISARKHYEEALLAAKRAAEAANEAKSMFLAKMSHELRTPLNAINGFSEIIKDEVLGPVQPAKYRQYANDIHDSGQHLLRIINDILDLSRIEAGKVTLADDVVELTEVAATAMKFIENLVMTKTLTVDNRLSPTLPTLRADERALRQIMINLLTNAAKFTPEGGRITVEAKYGIDGGLIVVVTDTGIGMTAAEIGWALQPFGRGISARARQQEGTGLGLVISKSLVELHGGQLVLASTPGVGTEVRVILPGIRVRRNHEPGGGLRGR